MCVCMCDGVGAKSRLVQIVCESRALLPQLGVGLMVGVSAGVGG